MSTETPRTVLPWPYCPECGDGKPRAAAYTNDPTIRQCNCLQEWFTDIDYTDVVQKNLAKRKGLERDLTDAHARIAELEKATQEAHEEKVAINNALNETDSKGIDEIEQIKDLAATIARLTAERDETVNVASVRSDEADGLAGMLGDLRKERIQWEQQKRDDTAGFARIRSDLATLSGVVAEKDKALEGVINSACHPEIAIRSVMVDLAPVRAALALAPATLSARQEPALDRGHCDECDRLNRKTRPKKEERR